MYLADRWRDFELLDAGNGEKLERWGDILLQRPDPQAVWPHAPWPRPHAIYHRSDAGGGSWQRLAAIPPSWQIGYDLSEKRLTFSVEPLGFKHTGLFPEQAANWDYIAAAIAQARLHVPGKIRVLNLFAYTGAATLACAAAGADELVHLDASRGMIARARENARLSGLAHAPIRWIQEDANAFVAREQRRGRRYEVILMDPPAYGRGPRGEIWKLEDALYALVRNCADILSENPVLFLVNIYAGGIMPSVLRNILELCLSDRYGGRSEASELGLPAARRPIVLPCGCTGRWTRS